MTKPSRWEREASEAGRKVTRRAIRRLDLLEWVGLGAAAGVAVGGGALVAALVVGRASPAFGLVWTATSVGVFLISGLIVALNVRKEARSDRRAERGSIPDERHHDEDHG